MIDKTDKYILMCEKAIKLQNDHKYTVGDYVYCKPDKKTTILVNGAIADCGYYGHGVWKDDYNTFVRDCSSDSKCSEDDRSDREAHVVLFKQDQLQDMLNKNLTVLVYDFYLFCTEEREHVPILRTEEFDSMEQLWLAFIMKEKFNKVWIKNNWKMVE